jgi:hypothetical protein
MEVKTMKHNSNDRSTERWMRTLWLPALILLAAVVTIHAPAEEKLPDAADVIAGFVEASGGREAYEKVGNRVTRANLELVGQGITLGVTIYAERPDHNYVVIESDVIGRIDKGSDGETVWETSITTGPQIKEGTERTDYLRESNFDKFFRWQELYESAEVTGTEDVDGRPCLKLVMTPPDSHPQSWYFDRESRLLVAVDLVSDTPAGQIPVKTLLGDYREVDGLLLPFETRIVVLGSERKLTMLEIRHDVELPADRFTPPQDVRELIAARQ